MIHLAVEKCCSRWWCVSNDVARFPSFRGSASPRLSRVAWTSTRNTASSLPTTFTPLLPPWLLLSVLSLSCHTLLPLRTSLLSYSFNPVILQLQPPSSCDLHSPSTLAYANDLHWINQGPAGMCLCIIRPQKIKGKQVQVMWPPGDFTLQCLCSPKECGAFRRP